MAQWKTPKMRESLNDKQLYVVSDDTCLHITNDRWAEVASLQSNQEEAGTRIILHAAHAAAEACIVGSCTGRASARGPGQPIGRAGPGFYDILRAGPGAGLKLAGSGRARAGK